jgi:Tol biopolymer transport system component
MHRLSTLMIASCIWLSPCMAAAGETELISVSAYAGEYLNAPSSIGWDEAVSGDGRFVVFSTYASNVLPGLPVGEQTGIYVRDRLLGTTGQVDLGIGGAQPNGAGAEGAISADGRYVAFFSSATNLVPGDTNASPDVFIRDRWLAKTTRASVAWDGSQSNPLGGPYFFQALSLSDDGQVVAFLSEATNLVPNDTNGFADIFVRDLRAGTTERVNLSSTGAQLIGRTGEGFSLSGDGRFIAFSTVAYGVMPDESSYPSSVYLRDRLTGQLERISRGPGGTAIDGWYASMSADGRYVAFQSTGRSTPTGSSVTAAGVRVYDRVPGASTLVSVSSSGAPANQQIRDFSISADGRFVGFSTTADNLVPVDLGNLREDVFLHDRQTRQTSLVSAPATGLHANRWSKSPSLSGDGRFVAFLSAASNLVPGVPIDNVHVYLRDMSGPVAPLIVFTLSPRALDFGDQALLTSRTQSFWLRNKGEAPLAINSIAVRGTDRAMFTRLHNCGAALAPGATCRIRVTFRPTSLGDKTATLRVVAAGDKVRDRALQGTGVAES